MVDAQKILFGNRGESLKKAFQLFSKTEQDLEQDINILKDWLKTQPHVPETPCDNMIMNVLIINKFSIEKAKVNLDMYYSMRPRLPELFQNKHPKLPHMKVAAKTMKYAAIPKLTTEGYRVVFCQLATKNMDEYNIFDIAAHGFNLFEVRLLNDVMIGDIYVIDMSNYTLAHASKLTPMHIKKLFIINEKVFKNIIKQMHFINLPSYAESIINLIKQMVKTKIADRIFAHSTSDALKEYLPLDVLPKEYGGEEYSLDELTELWMKQMESHNDRFDELEKMRIDESKRPAPLKNDELLGYHGNFKQLNVD